MLKFLGGTFLIIGAIIGGGIFALPIISVNFGFLTTSLFIVISWMLMNTTGLYVLDLSLSCPERYNSYYSIVGKFLGEKVQLVTIFLFLWLLYFALSSYISGCVSLIMSHISFASPLVTYFNMSIICVTVFGSLLVISAKIVFRLNVVLVTLKLGLLSTLILFSSTHHTSFHLSGLNVNYSGMFSLFMIIINAFGFQFIIPSLVSYYGRENRKIFRSMLITSTTIVLFLYLAWLYAIYNIIPLEGEHGFQAIYQSKNQLLAFNQSLLYYLHSDLAGHVVSLFEIIALFGSFFCVSLGVFDFLVDIFKTQNRIAMGLITFIPPLLLTLLSENMYIYAMSVAGYIAVFLEIVIPICAKKQLHRILGCNERVIS